MGLSCIGIWKPLNTLEKGWIKTQPMLPESTLKTLRAPGPYPQKVGTDPNPPTPTIFSKGRPGALRKYTPKSIAVKSEPVTSVPNPLRTRRGYLWQQVLGDFESVQSSYPHQKNPHIKK